MEQELEIIKNGQYNNLHLKSKPMKGIKGIEEGNHIIVEKLYDTVMTKEGKYGPYSIAQMKYKNTDCSTFLTSKEGADFDACGPAGIKVKITLTKEDFLNKMTGVEMKVQRLSFEKVDG